MFLHGSWDHILGNMLFLAIFGKNVEDALGHLRYLAFYVAGGFVATMTQTAATLLAGSAGSAHVPVLGASGAIAAVLGAYFVLYPNSRVLTLVLVFPVKIAESVFLGLWFLYQLVKRTTGSSRPARTVAAWRSSRTSAGSCSGCSSRARSWPRERLRAAVPRA